MKVLALCTATLLAVILVPGCSSSTETASLARQGEPIQGGSVDTSHNYAVGVCVGNGPGQCQLICSGALIAPNLVMTARHCVDNSPKAIDCTSSSTVFGAQYAPASYFYVTTYYQMLNQTKIGWHQGAQIYTTPGSLVCGNDMALIMLSDNVSLSEAGTFVTPVVQYSMTDHTRYSTTVTAIGYGDTDAVTMDPGTRHILQNVNLLCIPGDPGIPCPMDPQITNNEFVSGDSTCEGDSGSSAYEQKNFNKGVPVSFGTLSRGGASGSTCVQPIYTRTDAWSSFIVNTAITAASAGGYTPPAWTQPAPPPDAGAPPDAGSDGGPPPPPPGTLGASCSNASDCNSGLCESDDNGQTYICSENCDPSMNGADCDLPNYQCIGSTTLPDGGQSPGFCFPASDSDGGTSFNNGGGGCAVSASDPSKPVPWGMILLASCVLRRKKRDC